MKHEIEPETLERVYADNARYCNWLARHPHEIDKLIRANKKPWQRFIDDIHVALCGLLHRSRKVW